MNLTMLLSLVASILFLVLYGAGVFPWTLCVITAAFSLLLAVRRFRQEREFRARPLEIAYLAMLVFLLIHLAPLPLGATRITGPERYRQNRRAAEALVEADRLNVAPRPALWFSMTRERSSTLRLAALVVAAFGAGMLTARLPVRWRTGYLRFLVYTGGLVGAAGYVSQWRIPEGFRLWWFLPVPELDPGPIGCFINPNHFAGYLAILCPPAIVLLFADTASRRWVRAALCLAAFAAMTLAIAFSKSRGGVLAYAAGLGVTFLLYAYRRRPLTALGVGIAGVLILAGFLHLPNPAVTDRIRSILRAGEELSTQTRLAMWENALLAWKAYPVMGCGANSLRVVYPQHRVTSEREFATHVENEYVQLLAETGVVGVLLTLAVLAALVIELNRARRARQAPHALHAALGALAVAAVHAGCEFALHIPLYAVTLASIAGLALLPGAPGAGEDPPAAELSPARAASARLPAGVYAANLLAAGTLCLLVGRMHEFGGTLVPRPMDATAIAEAMADSPVHRLAWLSMAREAAQSPAPEARQLALRCAAQAGQYDPNNYSLWLDIGNVRLNLGDRAGARQAFARVRELRSWVHTPPVPED